MNIKESIRDRLPISQVRNEVNRFLKGEKRIHLCLNVSDDFPMIDVAEYRYMGDEQILILTRMSTLFNKISDNTLLSGIIYDYNGGGLKTTRRVYGKYVCKKLELDDKVLLELAKEDNLVKKMLTHGAKFFKLVLEEATAYLSNSEIYTLDKDMNASFSKYSLAGNERFENSRHIIMSYAEREVILNVIIEDGVYYTLTKANSNKMPYIRDGGICKIFDGRGNHFETKINILDDCKILEIFDKLNSTNNGYFKDTNNLKALSFSK